MKRYIPLARGLLLATTCAALGACSSPPAPRFHSLLSATTEQAAAPAQAPWRIELAPVKVPASVDQPQWVVRLPDDTLRILEQEQWVAPLRDELRAAIADRLAQHFAAADAGNGATPTAKHTWRVSIDVQRFESIVGREVWLDSTWSAVASNSNSPAVTCSSKLREAAIGDALALAAAHRRLVIRLADQIGATLAAPRSGEAVVCAKAS